MERNGTIKGKLKIRKQQKFIGNKLINEYFKNKYKLCKNKIFI